MSGHASPVSNAPRPRRRRRIAAIAAVAALVAGVVGVGGVAVLPAPGPAEAATISFEQCNDVSNVGGETVECQVTVVNTLTEDPLTTGSVVVVNGGAPTSSGDIVTSVTQCNGSANGGGSTLECSVSITNNIILSSPSAAVAATVNQCNDNQPDDGLGDAPNTCDPYPATTSGATITQCNGTGNGGGLVFPSGCTAAGTISASLPLTVNQCNGSANGGGAQVNCTASITTNVTATGNGTTTTTVGPTTTTIGNGNGANGVDDGTNGVVDGLNGRPGAPNGAQRTVGVPAGPGVGAVGSPRFAG
jgi:hypothetical protein